MSDHKTATFKATIAPILTGIKIAGDGSGMRIQLDIPESELANAMNLLVMRESVLQITVVDIGKTPLKASNNHHQRDNIDDILSELDNE